MSRVPLQTRLIQIVEPACNAAGYDLVDLRFLLEQGGWTLRICIDLPLDPTRDRNEVPEDRVDLTDCEEMSRELSAVIDVEDPITQAYSLEVGSPGIDRVLRTPGHFAYFVGSDAKIQLAVPLVVAPGTPGGERRNFRGTLRGVDGEAGHEHVTIEVDGNPFRLPIADIDVARLIPDWDAVMRGKSGLGGPSGGGGKPGKNAKSAKPTKPGAAKPTKPGKSTKPNTPNTQGSHPASHPTSSHASAALRGGDANEPNE